MFSDLVQQLNKQNINQFTLSFLGPSFIFWMVNIWVYAQFDPRVSLHSWHILDVDAKSILIACFVAVILTTAWILYEIAPFVYKFLQGRTFGKLRWLHHLHLKEFERLRQQDVKLANEIEAYKNMRAQLLDANIRGSDYPEGFSDFKKEVDAIDKDLSEKPATSMKDNRLVLRIRNVVSLFESHNAIWSANPDFNEVKTRLIKAYRVLLDASENKVAELEKKRSENFEKLTDYYPPRKAWIAATAFGNRWATIEAYSLTRYGIAMTLLWPRLYGLISKDVVSEIDRAKSQIDAYIAIWTLTCILSFLWVVYTIAFGRAYSLPLLLLLILSEMIILALSYGAASKSTVSYGKLVKASVDLYRRDVIKQVDLALPLTIEEEKEIWSILSTFWVANLNVDKLKFKEVISDAK